MNCWSNFILANLFQLIILILFYLPGKFAHRKLDKIVGESAAGDSRDELPSFTGGFAGEIGDQFLVSPELLTGDCRSFQLHLLELIGG